MAASLVSYGSTIDNHVPGVPRDEFSGAGLSLAGVIFPGDFDLGARGTWAAQRNRDDHSIRASTFELTALVGQHLASEGFKWYAGLGLFTEKWTGVDDRFTGGQITLGLGYNWERVALDFWLSGRDASDYESRLEKLYGSDADASAGAAALALGFRF